MAQLFRPESNRRFRVAILAVLIAAPAAAGYGFYQVRSPGYWNVGEPAPQPIRFPHSLHVGGLGVDCRYCHGSAGIAAYAGMPSAQTCLTCHSQLWRGVQVLEPLWTSAQLGQPIRWSSVHRQPQYVRFHHGAHVSAGVPCSTCHGDVAQMPRTVKVHTMSMGWCLDCHRRSIRSGQVALRNDPAFVDRHADDPRLTNCVVCHY